MRAARRSVFLVMSAVIVSAFVAVPAAHAVPTHISDVWAGVKAKYSTPVFTYVEGTWTVPKVKCAPGETSYSSTWVGLGEGTRQDTLFQTGTDSNCDNGKPQYAGFWEAYPWNASQPWPEVFPGDVIGGYVGYAANAATVTMGLADYDSTGALRWALSQPWGQTSDLSSAECVIERPVIIGSGGTKTYTLLAHFERLEVTYCAAHADQGISSGPLYPGWKVGPKEVYSLDMRNAAGDLLANSSHFTTAGGFYATWKAAA